jgi:hypothetical protein
MGLNANISPRDVGLPDICSWSKINQTL